MSMGLRSLRVALAVLALTCGGACLGVGQETPALQRIWTVPEIGALPNNAQGIPLFGLFGEFPRYNIRVGAEITIENRVNSCMTRSMNGRALPVSAPEMQAMVAYIKFLSTGVPPGELLPGLGTGKMPELDRPADPVRGKAGYTNACAICHGPDGAGIRRSLPSTDLGYVMPPLWGGDSFNDGAGMARLITAANFIHFNMPHGADYLNPQLSPEQAWDIAAYVISQPRPTFWKSRWMRRTVLMRTALASSSTNTGRSRPSVPRSQSSRPSRKAHRRADAIERLVGAHENGTQRALLHEPINLSRVSWHCS
jgi:mono/diheme cytochrome c family protein